MKSKTLVVGITRADLNINHDIGEYRRFVASHDRTIPIFAIDSRNRDEVKSLVRTLLYRIDPWL
jgi:signal recognition particle receptor subunit beta